MYRKMVEFIMLNKISQTKKTNTALALICGSKLKLHTRLGSLGCCVTTRTYVRAPESMWTNSSGGSGLCLWQYWKEVETGRPFVLAS